MILLGCMYYFGGFYFSKEECIKDSLRGLSAKENEVIEIEWIYETGREESKILGSGSTYYDVIKTKDEQKAFKEAMDGYHNYLVRYKKKDGITIARQWYDGYSKSWIDD